MRVIRKDKSSNEDESIENKIRNRKRRKRQSVTHTKKGYQPAKVTNDR